MRLQGLRLAVGGGPLLLPLLLLASSHAGHTRRRCAPHPTLAFVPPPFCDCRSPCSPQPVLIILHFTFVSVACLPRRGEIVENVAPPLPLDTPLLLVKPPVGLSTPDIFRGLDLARRSTADPRELLGRLAAEGATQELAVNDLEQPAFDRCVG